MNAFHHILRIYIAPEMLSQRLTDLVSYCRRTGCRDVLLFTSSYDTEPSFKPLEQIRRYTETVLVPAAAALSRAGIHVHLNVMQTLGHIYYPAEADREFPFQRRIAPDGTASGGGACPLDAGLIAWICAAYRIYAEVQPEAMLIDDDFRTVMEAQPSCFCDEHLRRIGAEAGYPVTRERMREAIFSEAWPPSPLRRIFTAVTTAGFAALAAQIRAAVKAVSPATRLGVMCAGWPVGAAGIDWMPVLRALSGDEVPILRPQVPLYQEANPRDFAIALMNPDCFRAMLSGPVEYWPELENYPFTGYSKSGRGALLQMFALSMQGFHHHALNWFDLSGRSGMTGYDEGIRLLEEQRNFLEAVQKRIPENSRPFGVTPFQHPDALLVRRSRDSWFGGHCINWYLPVLGLPVGYAAMDPVWQLLTGDDILACSDAEIDRMLKRGAMLDPTALEALTLRGFGERVGVRVGEFLHPDQVGYEEFLWPAGGVEAEFPLRFFLGKNPDWRQLIPIGTGKHVAASRIRDYRGDSAGAGVLLSENRDGERFAVCAAAMTGARQLMENRPRADQFRQVFAWIARRLLPFAATSDVPYQWVILNRDCNGNLVIGVINLALDRTVNLSAAVPVDFPHDRLRRWDNDGKSIPVTPRIVARDDRELRLEIPCGLEPLQFAVFSVDTVC